MLGHEETVPNYCQSIAPVVDSIETPICGRLWTVAKFNNKAIIIGQFNTFKGTNTDIMMDSTINCDDDTIYLMKDKNGNFSWTFENVTLSQNLRGITQFYELDTKSTMKHNETRTIQRGEVEEAVPPLNRNSGEVIPYGEMWNFSRKSNYRKFICWFTSYIPSKYVEDKYICNFY